MLLLNGTAPPRLPSLDAVRGLAILLVIGHHAAFRFSAAPGDPVAAFFRQVGWIGVDVFFALSGFLIVGILRRDAAAGDIRGFFRRRVHRIVPIFLVAVAAYAVAASWLGDVDGTLDRLWMTALLLNGWLIPVYGIDGLPFTITWSLSVEETAYVLFGAFAAWRVRSLVWVVLATIALASAVRWWALWAGAADPAWLYFFVPARLDAIAFGGIGALGGYAALVRGRYAGLAWGGVVFGLMVLYRGWTISDPWLPALGYAVFGLACAIWVTRLAGSPVPAVLDLPVRVLARIGEVSYFLYLFHMFFLDAVRLLGEQVFGQRPPYWAGIAVAGVACYAVARASWRWFEAPLIARGRQPRAKATA